MIVINIIITIFFISLRMAFMDNKKAMDTTYTTTSTASSATTMTPALCSGRANSARS